MKGNSMGRMRRLSSRLLLVILTFFASAVYAEKNLSGVWVGNYSEDYPDRLPGPELGDYTPVFLLMMRSGCAPKAGVLP